MNRSFYFAQDKFDESHKKGKCKHIVKKERLIQLVPS